MPRKGRFSFSYQVSCTLRGRRSEFGCWRRSSPATMGEGVYSRSPWEDEHARGSMSTTWWACSNHSKRKPMDA